MKTTDKGVAVLGAGSWGTAVANIIADNGFRTTLWGRDEAVSNAINTRHENAKYLPGVSLSSGLRGSTQLEEVAKEAQVIVCSIPTQHIRSVFSLIKSHLSHKLIINTSKGIEQGTHFCVSEVFGQLSPHSPYVIVSGPSFALEVGKRLPTAVTVASKDAETAGLVQQMISNNYMRAYTSKDVIGVELGGALKNVVAIAAGVVAGLKLGHNAQAAIINRGMAEIIRVALKRGASAMTFLGLSGVGDLILTCTGPLSRNRRLGILLGEGKSFAEAKNELGGVAEGAYTAQSAMELAKDLKVDMPITEQVYLLLYGGSTPKKALSELMKRDLRNEWEDPVGGINL